MNNERYTPMVGFPEIKDIEKEGRKIRTESEAIRKGIKQVLKSNRIDLSVPSSELNTSNDIHEYKPENDYREMVEEMEHEGEEISARGGAIRNMVTKAFEAIGIRIDKK